jgi:nitroreductase
MDRCTKGKAMMAEPGTVQQYLGLLRGLRAVRQFRPQPVPDQVLADLLDIARWSGSAKNSQPWEFLVIRNRDMLKALAALDGYVKHLAGAQLAIVLVMAGEHEEAETFDEGRLSERIGLAAAAHGLGSSIGWFAGAGRSAAKQLLGIPEERLVRTAISLGYPDVAAQLARPKPAQARKPLSELVHHERYAEGQ